MIFEVFKRFVLKENLIEYKDGVVVALSGGADSVFMTEMLLALKDEMDIDLVCVHLNHLYRGADANRDQAYCESYCMSKGIPLVVEALDIQKMATDEGLTFEEVGRRERYALFESVRKKYGFQKIAVAQNRDDQGETMLLHLFRGAGLKGLTGILPKRDNIIRPILSIGRLELESYLNDQRIGYCTDHTNFEEDYSRNFVRLSVLKSVKERLNPSVDKALFQTAEILQCDEDYMKSQVESIFLSMVNREGGNLSFALNDFNSQHLSIKRRLVRRLILEFAGNLQNIHHNIIDETIELCNNGVTGKRKPVKEGITLQIIYDRLVITSGIYEKTVEDKRGLHIDVGSLEDLLEKKNTCDVYIDYDTIKGPLFVRYRQAGDRFRPFGMKGTKKLKNHLIDLKIPREERDRLPLVCDDHGIVWIVGIGIADMYKVSGKTEKIAFLSYR